MLTVKWGRALQLLCVFCIAAFAKTSFAQAVSPEEFAEWAVRNNYQPGRDWRSYLLIAPGNMGPNALPIAPSNYARTDSVASFRVSGGGHARRGDQTADIHLEARYPFGRRASLCVRYQLREWYHVDRVLALSRNSLTLAERGSIDGDVHIEGLFQVLRQAARRPDITLAVRVKSASGSGLEALRYTDSPGYQFDATVAKDQLLREGGKLRPYASVGFFVWQRFGAGSPQNDAYTYAAGTQYRHEHWQFAGEVAGYSGWTEQLDRPVQLRGIAEWVAKNERFGVSLELAKGLRDFEYTTMRIGLNLRSLAQKK